MNNKFFLLLIGVLSIAGGIFAFFNPMAATLTAEQLIAWLFLFAGGLQLVSAWQYRGLSLMKWLAVGGVLALLIGAFLLFNPLKGALALTVIIAVLLLFSGFSRIAFAMMLKGSSAFFPTLLSGILSLVLAVFIFADFPQSAATILGIFLAIELVSNGVTMLFWSRQS